MGKSSSPHHTTVRLWVMRDGCAQLERPLQSDNNEKWALLADATVDIGVIKCFVVVGIRMNRWLEQENRTLSHSDLQVLGVYPTAKCDGEFVHKCLEEASERIGHENVLSLITDEGSDAKKGAKLYQAAHPKVIQAHDIPHKLSLLLEKELGDNEQFKAFMTKLNHTRQRVQQTELAALLPPKQRSKARFMNVHIPIHWAVRLYLAKKTGELSDISDERYAEYFGWIDAFLPNLNVWRTIIWVTETIKDQIRKKGLSKNVATDLDNFFSKTQLPNLTQANLLTVSDFQGKALDCILEETEKLNNDVVIPCSTESLESSFGKFKYVARYGGRGISGNVLRIPALTDGEQSSEDVKESLEGCSVAKVKKSVADFGETLHCSLRALTSI